jgi:hypothetical protein
LQPVLKEWQEGRRIKPRRGKGISRGRVLSAFSLLLLFLSGRDKKQERKRILAKPLFEQQAT